MLPRGNEIYAPHTARARKSRKRLFFIADLINKTDKRNDQHAELKQFIICNHGNTHAMIISEYMFAYNVLIKLSATYIFQTAFL